MVIALVWIVAVLLLGESTLSAYSGYSARRSADTTTTGQWVDVDGRCGRYIAYQVDGREHRLDTASGRHHCADVSEGEIIEITYDKDRPSVAYRGSPAPEPFLVLTVLAAMSTIAAAIAPLLWWRRQRHDEGE